MGLIKKRNKLVKKYKIDKIQAECFLSNGATYYLCEECHEFESCLKIKNEEDKIR